MKLVFLLRINGHLGIPDGEWELEGKVENDSNDAVQDKAVEMLRTFCRKHYGKSVNEEFLANMRIRRDEDYLVMIPGVNYEVDEFKYELTPMLEIENRYFELKEIEL